MDTFYLLIVGILILLAVSDLVIGVSNDAVNFLNSAIGSKAASFKVIMIIAALGILFGATFSSGMMDVARKGIFHPEHFFLNEIMIIFLAVMLTDIILLDLFNTFGLPTSTTVSIVFELLGAAVAVSIIKIMGTDDSFSKMSSYINTSSALLIITGILLSVVVAFSIGMIVQYFVRVVFTFNFEKNVRYFGALWGGIAISAITFFILIKGAKGASFMSKETVSWISNNTGLILGVSFVGWTILLQLLRWVFRLNILKLIVLVGTFALAMAFAGNDLVNFIGVPLAGLESFRAFLDSGLTESSGYLMTALSEPVKTPTGFLLIAGLIMVIALWTSKKARSVTATTLDLGRQEEGPERFEASGVARGIVRVSIGISSAVDRILPGRFQRFLKQRFDQSKFIENKSDKDLSFDLLRASVTLVVASALISLATSFKLPLSTTYVTFMVAMGTSLADGAWGRDSAVYRVAGVVTVIGGWFFTAFVAFTAAFIVAFLISWGGIISILGLVILAAFILYRSSRLHRKRDAELKKKLEILEISTEEYNGDNILISCTKSVYQTLSTVSLLFANSIGGLVGLKRKTIKRNIKEIKELNKEVKFLKNNIFQTISKLQEDEIESGHYYVQVLDYLRETAHSLTFIADPIAIYIDNNHPPLIKGQQDDLQELSELIGTFFSNIIQTIKDSDFSKLDDLLDTQQFLLDSITKLKKRQLKRIKNGETGTKNSELILNTLTETKNLLLYTVNLLKAQRDFVAYASEDSS
ncbi:MAG TPA: phosphate permease [Bacteroides sp.]|nr:phosphate permease [Bacteroides sp.]